MGTAFVAVIHRNKAVMWRWASLGLFLGLLFCSGCDPSGSREKGVIIDSTGKPTDPVSNILFFGNSITFGQGLDSASTFVSLLQKKIDSLKLPYKAINAGLPGETTAHGLTRVDGVLSTPFSIFVLELGGNDGLQKLSVASMTKNLEAIIDKVRKKYPSCKIVLAGMQIPASLGLTYTTDFKAAFPQIAAADSVYLIPFLLSGVGGIASLNQADGIHPNVQGEKIVAENVWAILHPLL